MYSMVVLMALQGGVDVPACGHRWGGGYCGGWGYGSYCGGWGYGGWGYGGYGGWCYAGDYYGGYVASVPAQPVSSPATIVVTLPANARVTVGDYVGRSSASERSFKTPPLPAGQLFSYTVKVEHNGKEQSRTITVRAGQVTRVNLSSAGAAVAAR